MRIWLVVMALFWGITVPCAGAWATYLHENELDNPCFENGGDSWEYSDNVFFDAKYDREHIAYDPPGYGESGYLRQVVDDSLFSGWDPLLNHKVGELSFWLYTTGPAYVKVGFDWWDSVTMSRPVPRTLADHFVLLDEEYRSLEDWTLVTIPFDWAGREGNNQPRWVSVEIYFYGCSQTGFEAAVDTVYFTGQCIPEPSSLIALFGGLLSAGAVLRRRR